MNASLPTTAGDIYDYPKYYDLVYGSDWKAELDFLLDCFESYGGGRVKRVFEPACGTGRLLFRLAGEGCRIGGLDMNPKMVAYCNERLERHGHADRVCVGDMSDYTVDRPYDAAFNLINSFRHLDSQRAAEAHLRCVAASLAPGGLYFLGLHLTPTAGVPLQEESWPARRGNLAVLARLWITEADYRRRFERVGMSYDVYTPTRQFRIEGSSVFRTYTAKQFQRLLAADDLFEVIGTHDFAYDATNPIEVTEESEDVVYVLRRRPG